MSETSEFRNKLQRMIDVAEHEAASFRPESWVRLTTGESKQLLVILDSRASLVAVAKAAQKIMERHDLALEPVPPHWAGLRAALSALDPDVIGGGE